ncbi:NfeD family protein [Novosphingobium sp.]|uniref:NfeD family protein n=1 Tax=Novosphingobium sp. TaxID=1874826 RepID=UPI00286BA049|nr:NfeD family protein [Novosphingobium sp.]
MAWLDTVSSHWLWLALGLLLAIAEITIPGLFLIWLAGAALITGVVAWLAPIGMPLQIVLFSVLSVVSVFIGRSYLRSNPIESADPMLNHRGAQAIGQVVMVTQVITAGRGRVKLGDSEWIAAGPDAEPGTRMKVTATEGAVLVVEHLH